ALTTLHFAPTSASAENLRNEGVDQTAIHITGNTVIDALFKVIERLNQDEGLRDHCNKQFPFLDENKQLILVTGHRRESFGGGFERICSALAQIAEARSDVQIVYP